VLWPVKVSPTSNSVTYSRACVPQASFIISTTRLASFSLYAILYNCSDLYQRAGDAMPPNGILLAQQVTRMASAFQEYANIKELVEHLQTVLASVN